MMLRLLLRLLLPAVAALGGAACSTPAVVEPGPPASSACVQRVLRVSRRVLPQFPESRCTWCRLIPSWTPNARIDNRGSMEITTGLLELCADDDQLAFVVAHELAHEKLGHLRSQRRQLLLQALAAGLAAWAVQESSGSGRDAALAGGGVLLSSTLLATLPEMRRRELEADLAARDALHRAGYRMEAAATFWRRYARARPGRELPAWLSTHPADAQRAKLLELRAATVIP